MPKTNDGPQDFDWGESLINDPNRTLGLLAQTLETKIKKDLREEHERFTGQTNFWTQFYTANGDLREDMKVVEQVLADNNEELLGMQVHLAIPRLAELTRNKLAADDKRRRRSRGEHSAYSGGPGFSGAAPDAGEADSSLGATIRRNRARRRDWDAPVRDAD